MRVMVICDCSSEIGFGHIMRCLPLADELHNAYGCHISFAMKSDANGIAMVREHGYTVFNPIASTDFFDYKHWLNAAIVEVKPDIIVLDIRDDLPRSILSSWRACGIKIVTIDDPSERRLDADLAFYPPVPQVSKMDWTGFSGQLYTGWEWVILRPEFSKHSASKNIYDRLQILVTMGGSDPAGLTLKVLAALDGLNEEFDTKGVLGFSFMWNAELDALLGKAEREFTILRNVSNMAEVMSDAHFAIASFGVTAYELAAMGVPALYLCLTEDHAESATTFEQAGLAISLGNYATIDFAGEFIEKTRKFLTDKNLLQDLTHKNNTLIDACGARRIAQTICEWVGENERVART